MYMDRKKAGQVGRETVAILEKGQYQAPNGQQVSIRDSVQQAIAHTTTYRPDAELPPLAQPSTEYLTDITVDNITTLQAARTLQESGYRVAALNFASAKNPGGGFQNGARAQEESLARSSGLFACIEGNPMYAYHRSNRSCMYSHYAIFSPDVPVFRKDEGELLSTPYPVSFLTCPAVNAGVVRSRKRASKRDITNEMNERIHRVLHIAALHEHDAIVLGAWGCGVFRNDPTDIARMFARALTSTFDGRFRHVAFAVLDSSKKQHFIGPFYDSFGRRSLVS